MLINIDPDQLRKEREQLTNRLQQIDWLLNLTTASPTSMLTIEKVPDKLPIKTTADVAVIAEKSRRGFKQGIQRDILLVLLTGPAKDIELVECLKQWRKDQIYTTLRRLATLRYVFFSETGHVTLAPVGRNRATWFQKHPSFVSFKGKRINDSTIATSSNK